MRRTCRHAEGYSVRGLTYWLVKGLRGGDAFTLACGLALLLPWDVAASNAAAVLILLLVLPLSQHFLTRAGVYDSQRMEASREVVRKLAIGYLPTVAIILAATAIAAPAMNLAALALVFALCFVLLATTKVSVNLGLRRLRRLGYNRKNVLFVGTWEQAEGCARALGEHPEWGLQLDCVAIGESAARTYVGFPDCQPISSDLEEVLKLRVIDDVVIRVTPDSFSSALDETRRMERYGLLVRLVIERPQQTMESPTFESHIGSTSLAIGAAGRDEHQMAVKRAFDFTVAALLLIAVSPLMLLIAIAVKLTSPGPVLFSQLRVGLNGRRFRMYKFRTMVDGAEFLVRLAHRSITRGPIFKDPDDYRVTSVGRLLRRYSLDELPQLWNVVCGEMSLVGPRPLPVYEAEKIEGEYRRRFSVPPGLTCIWQISGRSDVTYDKWMQYDLQYVDGWSFWSDTKLLFRTIPVVLTGRGGY